MVLGKQKTIRLSLFLYLFNLAWKQWLTPFSTISKNETTCLAWSDLPEAPDKPKTA